MIEIQKLKNKLSYYILAFIAFQQFPVIRIGGSFKIYELLALLLLIVNILSFDKTKKITKLTFILFCFFVASPVISYVLSYITQTYPIGFYNKYPEANSFKYNYYFFPTLQLIFMFFNYAAFNTISSSKYIYDNVEKVIKTSIIIATVISIYSLISMVSFDVVQALPSFIQNKSKYYFRGSGLSQEPGIYVLYQAWICLFVFYSRHFFKQNIWLIIAAINVASLLSTISTTLIALPIILLFSVFVFKSSFKNKLIVISVVFTFLLIAIITVYYYNLFDSFDALFTNKIANFFQDPDHTLDSGSFRRYTSRIGLKMFNDNFFTGVGVGKSIYYMYLYEFKMGIRTFGLTLEAGIFPQNLFSIVLSEQGIIGGISLLSLIIYTLKKLWKNRSASKYHQMFFIGTLFNISAMLTLAPAYSFYIWAFIALALCYNKFYKYNFE
ncbi:O-antigen ligase-like membrane protein [Mucilaginibacter gracilis]|uniref:O-antigen ligase-like membrane protein n=1 Tax=Mucilaginibacter gracilis TaxID=423350 RepID=A0A495IWE7_9SPHI|nr:O-antigen ligase family protein [Mucilaginibacter gracilis]RKR81076.1 O-antigen ligase-like membrane protein [Mucilaginibacter gracilis]